MTENEWERPDMGDPADEAMLTQLAEVLEDMPLFDFSMEDHRAVHVAMLRAQSGTLTDQEQFLDASEFFGLEIVQALQAHTGEITEAAKWLGRPGLDREERLRTFRQLISQLLGLDLLTFLYLLHVARVASLPPGSLGTVH
jgi:hypothetical protein